jgi:hypothetical protein
MFLIANAALIVPATLLVKEHTVIDVCGGVLAAVLSLTVAKFVLAAMQRRGILSHPAAERATVSPRPAMSARDTKGSRLSQPASSSGERESLCDVEN